VEQVVVRSVAGAAGHAGGRRRPARRARRVASRDSHAERRRARAQGNRADRTSRRKKNVRTRRARRNLLHSVDGARHLAPHRKATPTPALGLGRAPVSARPRKRDRARRVPVVQYHRNAEIHSAGYFSIRPRSVLRK